MRAVRLEGVGRQECRPRNFARRGGPCRDHRQTARDKRHRAHYRTRVAKSPADIARLRPKRQRLSACCASRAPSRTDFRGAAAKRRLELHRSMGGDAELLRKACDHHQHDRRTTPDLVAKRFHEWPMDLDSGEFSTGPPQRAVSATAANGPFVPWRAIRAGSRLLIAIAKRPPEGGIEDSSLLFGMPCPITSRGIR